MLDRLPTELLRLVLDAASACIWAQKRILDRLGLVSKSYRRSAGAVSDRIVRINCRAAIDIIQRWPATRRGQVEALLIGSNSILDAVSLIKSPVPWSDIVRLLALLPNVDQVYLRNFDVAGRTYDHRAPSPERVQDLRRLQMTFAERALFGNCIALSIRQTPFDFDVRGDVFQLTLRRLHLEVLPEFWNSGTEAALDGLFSRDRLPQLRLLRLGVLELPDCLRDFLDGLHAIQLDLLPNRPYGIASGRAFLETKTPILYSFGPPSSEMFQCSLARYITHIQICTRHWSLLQPATLPRLENVFCLTEYDDDTCGRFAAHADVHRLEQSLQALAARHEIVMPAVYSECPAAYDFLQPAFVKHLRISKRIVCGLLQLVPCSWLSDDADLASV